LKFRLSYLLYKKNLAKDLLQKEIDAVSIDFMYDFPFETNQIKTWLT
jgi:hypothetical protein